MLNSCTPVSNKINILDSFEKDDGCIKVLVATFGMGVDCKKVYRTIHFGPAKNIEIESYMQESGRCGRDGVASIA
jgi:ATP-dependent DNA helicase RecQ